MWQMLIIVQQRGLSVSSTFSLTLGNVLLEHITILCWNHLIWPPMQAWTIISIPILTLILTTLLRCITLRQTLFGCHNLPITRSYKRQTAANIHNISPSYWFLLNTLLCVGLNESCQPLPLGIPLEKVFLCSFACQFLAVKAGHEGIAGCLVKTSLLLVRNTPVWEFRNFRAICSCKPDFCN